MKKLTSILLFLVIGLGYMVMAGNDNDDYSTYLYSEGKDDSGDDM